jgi:hypothetical protein
LNPFIVETFLSEKEVYSSGAITVRNLEPVNIQLRPEANSPPYKVLVKFFWREGQEISVGWSSLPDRSMEISIINFDSPWGLTIHRPIPIGTFNEKRIFLDFTIYTLGSDPKSLPPKLFCYTLFAEG